MFGQRPSLAPLEERNAHDQDNFILLGVRGDLFASTKSENTAGLLGVAVESAIADDTFPFRLSDFISSFLTLSDSRATSGCDNTRA